MTTNQSTHEELVALAKSRGMNNFAAAKWAGSVLEGRAITARAEADLAAMNTPPLRFPFTQLFGRAIRPIKAPPKLINLGDLTAFNFYTDSTRAEPDECQCPECVSDRAELEAATNQPDQTEADAERTELKTEVETASYEDAVAGVVLALRRVIPEFLPDSVDDPNHSHYFQLTAKRLEDFRGGTAALEAYDAARFAKQEAASTGTRPDTTGSVEACDRQ